MTAYTGQFNVRKGTSAQWASSDPTLVDGEPGLDTDLDRIKIGNGASAWSALGWLADTPFTPPPTSGWSTTTLGSATFAVDKVDRLLTMPTAAGDNWRIEYRTLSPASNYTATAYIDWVPGVLNTNFFQGAGIVLRNSGSGSFVAHSLDVRSAALQLLVTKWTNPTTFSATYATMALSLVGYTPQWFRVVDNGTNRISQISPNGLDWYALHTVGRTDFITPDQIGWGGNNSTGATGYVRLRHFTVA